MGDMARHVREADSQIPTANIRRYGVRCVIACHYPASGAVCADGSAGRMCRRVLQYRIRIVFHVGVSLHNGAAKRQLSVSAECAINA